MSINNKIITTNYCVQNARMLKIKNFPFRTQLSKIFINNQDVGGERVTEFKKIKLIANENARLSQIICMQVVFNSFSFKVFYMYFIYLFTFNGRQQSVRHSVFQTNSAFATFYFSSKTISCHLQINEQYLISETVRFSSYFLSDKLITLVSL